MTTKTVNSPAAPRAAPSGRLRFASLRIGKGRYGVNFSSRRALSGISLFAGINFSAMNPAEHQAGVNVGIFPQEKKQDGINLGLFNAFKFQRGINLGILGNTSLNQTGINMGIFQVEDWESRERGLNAVQKGISLGLANFFSYQKGITAGGWNNALSQGGINLGALNTAGNQEGITIGAVNVNNQYAPRQGGTIDDDTFGRSRGVVAGAANFLGEHNGVSASVLNLASKYSKGAFFSAISYIDKLKGLSASAFQFIGSARGAALSAILLAEKFKGVCAGIVQVVGEAKGVALSVISKAKSLRGVSASLMYSGAETLDKGLLIAPITRVTNPDESTGLQVGLMNIVDDGSSVKCFPVFARHRKKH